MSTADLRPLSLGELLDRMFTLYRRHFWLFVGIMALPALFAVASTLLQSGLQRPGVLGAGSSDPASVDQVALMAGLLGLGTLASVVVYWVVYAVALGATTFALSEVYLGRAATVRGAYRKMWGKVWRLIDVIFSVGLRVAGTFFILFLLAAMLVALVAPQGNPAATMLVGFLALNGQSPGKRYTRLRVIKDSGRPINPYEAIARNLLRLVDQLPGIYAVGILSMLISPRNKRLGDWVAGTVVVHEKPFEGMKFALELPEETAAPVTPDARLSLEEFELVETFLQRREALAPDVRLRTAEQIAERLRAKLGLSQEQQGPETFLEAVARAHRRAARYR